MQVYKGKTIETLVPASGLVTALEPFFALRRNLDCVGIWRRRPKVVDEQDHIRGAADQAGVHRLRRVWLSNGGGTGPYYGFSNEGLWPVWPYSHPHTRPIFRASDWQSYQTANREFADAVTIKKMRGSDRPLVLVQDYHFALLRGMIKEARPDARVAISGTVPWPIRKRSGICPWQRNF